MKNNKNLLWILAIIVIIVLAKNGGLFGIYSSGPYDTKSNCQSVLNAKESANFDCSARPCTMGSSGYFLWCDCESGYTFTGGAGGTCESTDKVTTTSRVTSTTTYQDESPLCLHDGSICLGLNQYDKYNPTLDLSETESMRLYLNGIDINIFHNGDNYCHLTYGDKIKIVYAYESKQYIERTKTFTVPCKSSFITADPEVDPEGLYKLIPKEPSPKESKIMQEERVNIVWIKISEFFKNIFG